MMVFVKNLLGIFLFSSTAHLGVHRGNRLLTKRGPIMCELRGLGIGKGGGGGANTNKHGKLFEQATSNEPYLLADGYVPCKEGFLMKDNEDALRFYGKQTELNSLLWTTFGVRLIRRPDEIYMTVWKNPEENRRKHRIKILEKKAQYGQGSVETKLWAADGFLHEYREVLGERFEVEYAFCVNRYLEQCFTDPSAKKKYRLLQDYLGKKGVPLFFGEDPDYFQQLHHWIRRDA